MGAWMQDLDPQDQAAAHFMAHKGYPTVQPYDIEKVDGEPCWYYLYFMEEGILELEVSWNRQTQDWETMVTTFTPHEDDGRAYVAGAG